MKRPRNDEYIISQTTRLSLYEQLTTQKNCQYCKVSGIKPFGTSIISPQAFHSFMTASRYYLCRLDVVQPNTKYGEKAMKNKISVLIAGLLVALVVMGVLGATNAYAQSPANAKLHGGGPGGRGLGLEGLQAAAQALNMTTDELINALRSGKTLEELATEAGVELQDVQDAIQAAHATSMRERIQQALDAGTITQEHADWLLEGLEKGFIDGPGGFGPGGHRGTGPGLKPDQAPTVQPTQQSGG
jgi:hypothetical protein